MKKITFPAIITILTVLIFTSCKKGDSGPAGPVGPAGPTGVAGPEGNANVSVDTFTLTSSDWLWNSSYSFTTENGSYTSYFTRYHDRSFSKLTADVLDKGIVLVYFTSSSATNSSQWTPLNFSFLAFSYQYYYHVAYETFAGKLRLHYFYTPNGPGGTVPYSALATAVITNYKFKIIVAPGNIGARTASGLSGPAYTAEQLKKMPYETVCRLLGIKE